MKYNYTYTELSHDTRTIEVTCQRPLTSDEVLELSCEVDYKDGSTAKNILEDGKKYKVTYIGTDYGNSDYEIEGDELLEKEEE